MAADPDFRPWSELFPDALGLIFSKLNSPEVVQVIPLVCKSWCQVVEGPYCWQRIDTRHFLHETSENETDIMKVKRVLGALLPRSSGYLRELYVSCTDDDILSFIAEHAGSLATLDIGIGDFKASTFEQFATKLGTLTTLVVRGAVRHHTLKAIVKNCKRLVSLSWDYSHDFGFMHVGKCSLGDHDCFVWSMPNLKRLYIRQVYLMQQSCLFSLISGSPELEWLKMGDIFEFDKLGIEIFLISRSNRSG